MRRRSFPLPRSPSRRTVRPRYLALLATIGCASISGLSRNDDSNPGVAASQGTSVAPSRQGAVEYTGRLVPSKEFALGRTPAADSGDGGELRTSGTMRIVVREDDTFEYQVTVQNEELKTFTAGLLYRMNPGTRGTAVATLFSDVTLSNRYIQMRGTGTVSRGVNVRDLMEQLRQRPAEFVVRLESRGSPAGALLGTLR